MRPKLEHSSVQPAIKPMHLEDTSMQQQCKIELAQAIIAANEWSMQHGTAETPGKAAVEALDATFKGDEDLRRLLELILWWPDDANVWANGILDKQAAA